MRPFEHLSDAELQELKIKLSEQIDLLKALLAKVGPPAERKALQ